MNKKIIATAALISSMPIYAQESQQQVKLYCNDTKFVFETLRKDYGEEPFVYGKVSKTTPHIMTLWINPKTSTWTMLVSTGDKTCIMGGGSDLNIVEAK